MKRLFLILSVVTAVLPADARFYQHVPSRVASHLRYGVY